MEFRSLCFIYIEFSFLGGDYAMFLSCKIANLLSMCECLSSLSSYVFFKVFV